MDDASRNRKYYDRDVCHLYLVGLCPHELFQLTLRKEYQEAKSKGIDNYERELEVVINKLIGECDAKIGRELQRLEDDDAIRAIKISVSEVTEILKACQI